MRVSIDVVVVEWLDSIVECFRQGAWILRSRLYRKRREQYQCFSVLYVLANRRKDYLDKLKGAALVGDSYPAAGKWARRLSYGRRLSKSAAKLRESIGNDPYLFSPNAQIGQERETPNKSLELSP